jgi:hypothetical protein
MIFDVVWGMSYWLNDNAREGHATKQYGNKVESIAHKAECLAHKAEWIAHKLKNASTGEAPRVLVRMTKSLVWTQNLEWRVWVRVGIQKRFVNQPPDSPEEPQPKIWIFTETFRFILLDNLWHLMWLCRNSGKIKNSENFGEKWSIWSKITELLQTSG